MVSECENSEDREHDLGTTCLERRVWVGDAHASYLLRYLPIVLSPPETASSSSSVIVRISFMVNLLRWGCHWSVMSPADVYGPRPLAVLFPREHVLAAARCYSRTTGMQSGRR